MECFIAVGGFRGFLFASGSPDTESDGRESGCPWDGVSSPAGDTDMTGGHQRMPDLSLEGPFDVHQDQPLSGASPRVLDGMRGCQYRMTSYDQESGGPDFSPVYGMQLHDPRLLEHVGAPESARLLSRSPQYWLHHLGHEKTLAAALQLQHDAFPADAMQRVVPSYRVRQAAHYMAAMGLWRPPSSQGVRGPLPSATCNACMSCSDYFPDLP